MIGKSGTVFDFIKERIIDGSYAPLTPIPEREIIAALHTSRTPVREALLRLHELGFVYIYPSKGTIVSELNLDLINELYETRLLCEPTVNVEAACRVGVDELRSIERAFQDRAKTGDRAYFIELDNRLHELLLSRCRNRFLKKSLQTVYEHNRRLRRFVLTPISVTEHHDLIEAVLSGDGERIKVATLAHLRGSREHTMLSYDRGELKVLATRS